MRKPHGRPRLTTARRQLLDQLLDQLLELDETARASELAAIATRAPRVHRWLVELLAASTEPTNFLDTIFERVGQAAGQEARSRNEVVLPPGTRLGPWRIEEAVGSGGMGTVYRADRADGAFSMTVAVKLIRLRREDLDERLKLERELLARLDHRNIARLIDGGTTDDGQAYLVMEWIEGHDLHHYLREKLPDQAARLELFAQIANAVAHAHRRRVVHGDLKPANIRVTAEGEVRLLDFGVARLIENDNSAEESSRLAMTPAFSAPEQLRGEGLSTLSDVWSLGVLLAWLLGGRLPDQDTPIAELLPADLPGRDDLWAIVAMACEVEPERRYDGIPLLLEDVERSRRHLPIRARTPTRSYLLRRFVRRHRLWVATGTAACLAISLALGTALWQAHMAGVERDRAQVQLARAEQETRKSSEVSDFLVGLFEQADPGSARGEEITARQLLDTGIERASQLDGQPQVQSEMYRVLGRVQMNLGNYDSAHELADSALALHQMDDGTLSSEAAGTLIQLGDINLQMGNPDKAIGFYRRGLAMLESVESELGVEALLGLGGGMLNAGDQLEEAIELLERALAIGERFVPGTPLVAAIHNNLGAAAYYEGQYDDAIRHFDQSIEFLINHFGSDHPRVMFGQTNLAFLLTNQARYAEAEAMLTDLIDAQERVLGADHPHRAANLHTMGSLQWQQDRTDQAIEWWERALDARAATFGMDHPDVAATQNSLALALVRRGDLRRAESLYEQSLQTLRNAEAAQRLQLPQTLSNLADLRFVQDRHDDAMELHQEALELRLELTSSDHPHVGFSRRSIARLYLEADQVEQAREWAMSSLEVLQAAYEDASHPEIGETESLIERIDARQESIPNQGR